MRNTLQLLQLTPPDKARQADPGQRDKLAERMHACEEADARTPIEREKLQQQRLLDRRAKAREDSCKSTRSRLIRGAEAGRAEAAAAAEAAAPPPSAAAAEEAEESEPVQSGAMLAVVDGEGGEWTEL